MHLLSFCFTLLCGWLIKLIFQPKRGKTRTNHMLTQTQAVPFWLVERSREIAEREKTGANERRGAWGEAGKRGKEKKPVSSRLFLLTPVSLRCECTLSTNQKGTACSLMLTCIFPHWEPVTRSCFKFSQVEILLRSCKILQDLVRIL